MNRLGAVGNGETSSGEVAFNMFTILISAEPPGEHRDRKGKLVMRGMSPSSLMEGHDLLQMAPLALMNSSGDAHEEVMGHEHHQGEMKGHMAHASDASRG